MEERTVGWLGSTVLTLLAVLLMVKVAHAQHSSNAADTVILSEPMPEKRSQKPRTREEIEESYVVAMNCSSDGVMDAGYVIQAFDNPDGTFKVSISENNFAGTEKPLFEGRMSLTKSPLSEDGKEVFELKDSEKDSQNVIRLVKDGQDKLLKLRGVSDLGFFSNLDCRPYPKMKRIMEKLLSEKK